MAVIKVEDPKEQMIDVGEMVRDWGDDDVCCDATSPEEAKPKKMKKSYPNLYMYEVPDELYNALSVGTEYELTIKCKVSEMSERVSESENDGKKEKRTIDLSIMEVSKPQ